MARQSKNLSNAFERFSDNKNETKVVMPVHEQKQETVIEQQKQETEKTYVTSNSNNSSNTKDVTLNSNTKNVTLNQIKNDNTNTEKETEILNNNITIEDVKQNLLSMYEKKTKKETVEDTHTRTTFLFRKDLAKRLDKLSKNKRGFKTMFMNKAIEALLDEMEKK